MLIFFLCGLALFLLTWLYRQSGALMPRRRPGPQAIKSASPEQDFEDDDWDDLFIADQSPNKPKASNYGLQNTDPVMLWWIRSNQN